MKASELLEEIKSNIKDYNIDYLKNKVTDDRYKDPLTKSLAKYNSEAYDEIYQLEINEDYNITDKGINGIKEDIDNYFAQYNPHDEENQNLIRNLCLYYAFIAKIPLHPFGDNPKKDNVYKIDNNYFCKERIKSIKVDGCLCKYCCCKNATFEHLFFFNI